MEADRIGKGNGKDEERVKKKDDGVEEKNHGRRINHVKATGNGEWGKIRSGEKKIRYENIANATSEMHTH